ncbi:hypothetical protein DPMN_100681 [Dreissena polymorpha]|uniref:Uncharacterized protein n=1 Tax=Dreissena polymorpha TaxID=45954 RepID=A0A9D4R8V7_DREPO|nr:hypothetical protein DPMN_100681 [Dreissena polymorpha]
MSCSHGTIFAYATVPRVDDDVRPMPFLELNVPIDMPVTSDETDDLDPFADPVNDNGVVDPFADDTVQ